MISILVFIKNILKKITNLKCTDFPGYIKFFKNIIHWIIYNKKGGGLSFWKQKLISLRDTF